jgi:3-phytase
VSAYNVYHRAAPHGYLATFTIVTSSNGKVDGVSNNDGITAVGTSLGDEYPNGVLVVHDDANQLAEGGTSEEASLKLVSLEKVLGAPAAEMMNLLQDIDTDWDPRS